MCYNQETLDAQLPHWGARLDIMTDTITPRLLKGFRDLQPAEALRRELLLESLRRKFRVCGFLPIDTPVLEYSEILLGKGGGESDKQLYRFTDHGGRDVSMRFDLTVPLARYMAQHGRGLPVPFRRYHIGKVFRGENTQRGRYREFIQCDFDIVGVDTAQVDCELLVTGIESLSFLGENGVTVRVSHSGVLPVFLRSRPGYAGLAGNMGGARGIIDKRYKRGAQATMDDLRELAESSGTAIPTGGDLDDLASFIELGNSTHTCTEGLAGAEALIRKEGKSAEYDAVFGRLREVMGLLGDSGYGACVRFDPAITRGLDYYTGIIFECYDSSVADGGAICSGGRYDGLISLYGGDAMPAVGGSIGIDRLLGLRGGDSGLWSASEAGMRTVVFLQGEAEYGECARICREVRGQGIACEIYPQPHPLAKQFRYAELSGIMFGLFYHADNPADRRYELRRLDTREREFAPDITGVCKLVTNASQKIL